MKPYGELFYFKPRNKELCESNPRRKREIHLTSIRSICIVVSKKHVYLSMVLMCTARSTRRLEYPHSLSYQEMTLWKVSLREMQADASMIDDLSSCTKS
mmetsp:Transcript_23567/g.56878  ORF Transcript_23567/g.56878 Transcript_23567/m.56878 type:complete len:99 (-) Transcript_23567:977-1273(-)